MTEYAPNGKLKHTITKDMTMPDALVFDSQGSLYVATEEGGVVVFPPGRRTPAQVIRNGVDNPSALALSFR